MSDPFEPPRTPLSATSFDADDPAWVALQVRAIQSRHVLLGAAIAALLGGAFLAVAGAGAVALLFGLGFAAPFLALRALAPRWPMAAPLAGALLLAPFVLFGLLSASFIYFLPTATAFGLLARGAWIGFRMRALRARLTTGA